MKRNLIVVFVFALIVGVAAAAWAAEGYNAELFQPSIFGGNFVAIEDSHTLCPLGFGFGLLLNYANGPVEVRVDKKPELGIVNTLFTSDILAAFGPISWLSIGLDAPLHLYARARQFGDVKNGGDVSGLASQTRMGDLRAELKFRALQQSQHWLGMAVAPYATFPTGDAKMFLGEGRVTGGGNLMLEHDFSALNVGLTGGYLYRGTTDVASTKVGNAIKAGAGISRAFQNGISFSIEYWASWVSSENQKKFQSDPMEALGTIRYQFGPNMPRVIGGVAGGLTSGVGCPAYRLVAGVDYYYCPGPPQDGKLVVQVVDVKGAPLTAQLEIKGPQNEKTPTNAKGRWKSDVKPGGYEIIAAKEGYISASAKDTVKIGETTYVTLKLAKTPTLLKLIVVDKASGEKIPAIVVFDLNSPKENKWDVPGERTDPAPVGEHKLIVTSVGYEEVFTDVTVAAETTTVKRVELRKKIMQIGKIYFDYDSDVIRKESYPVLNDVVAKIKALKQYKKIIIEGHCSGEGTDEYNMKLSQRRATSVKKYLVSKGLDAAKLDIEAYGKRRPIATNDTEDGREKNRRVEFIVEE